MLHKRHNIKFTEEKYYETDFWAFTSAHQALLRHLTLVLTTLMLMTDSISKQYTYLATILSQTIWVYLCDLFLKLLLHMKCAKLHEIPRNSSSTSSEVIDFHRNR